MKKVCDMPREGERGLEGRLVKSHTKRGKKSKKKGEGGALEEGKFFRRL